MSDKISDLTRQYQRNVYDEQQPRSIGLFPIPEFPELESGQGMWTTALDVILTTLRYLAPATLLSLFWGQQSFLFRLLKSIDNAFRAIVFSSEEQKDSVLQWLAEAGPVRVEHLDTVWRHGWIVCGVLDAALPGACAGHPPTRLSIKHAQTIADHYLGVEPVFTRNELESNDSLSKHQEWKLATYLERIRESLSKLSPPVSKPTSQRTSPEMAQVTLDYVAKGSGLTAAQIGNKMHFKIYPTSQQCMDPGEITILIRGPKDTYGLTVLPPILGKAQIIRQKMLGLQNKTNYTENALPITHGATYLRSYGKNDMNKTYYIPKSKYDIEIEEDIREDNIKIGYIVPYEGKYEISITSRGQNIVGSPFTATATHNIIRTLERDSFCLEDGEEIDIVDVTTDRKVVLRIVDFVTEKMLLRENGSLEKISDDEAKKLMASEDTSVKSIARAKPEQMSDVNDSTVFKEDKFEGEKVNKTNENTVVRRDMFKRTAYKIIAMNRVCKIIRELTDKTKQIQMKAVKMDKIYKRSRNQKDIPDVVNSTFTEQKYNPFIIHEQRDKIVIPENISVNLITEKPQLKNYEDFKTNTITFDDVSPLSTPKISDSSDSLETYESLEQQIEEQLISERPMSSNPFVSDILDQSYAIEKELGTFVKTEYETNNSQNEETQNTSITINVEGNPETPSPTNKNPFLDPDVINMERPKTPVLKIITGEVTNRDSVYVDPKNALLSDDMVGNEFLNPFFLHHHQSNQQEAVTDFIIGAPVSLPPIIRATTPEPQMESILMTDTNQNKDIVDKKNTSNTNEVSSLEFSTPLHINNKKPNSGMSSTFHSLDSEDVEILSLSNASDEQECMHTEDLQSERNLTPRKDMWDSAYVSIDDNNSSPDTNNNDNLSSSEIPKQKLSASDNNYMLSNMGPAEKELWQSCKELKEDLPKSLDDVKLSKWETKRSIFTPIIEETDRSISSGIKESQKSDKMSLIRTESDAVTVAFAEINEIYDNYTSTSEANLATTTKDIENKSKERKIRQKEESVDSASVITDVKRHAEIMEGKISEVQPSVTESAVSQTLQSKKLRYSQTANQQSDETQFGDKKNTNIVMERKQYWDERIREIEAKSEESKTQQRRRRLSSKHLRHSDSLTKRRGKQIAKSLHNTENKTTPTKSEAKNIINARSPLPQLSPESDIKLVEKWKKYWDSKLDIDQDDTSTTCFKTKSSKSKDTTMHTQNYSHEDIVEVCKTDKLDKEKSSTLPVKQELPEEVFKAFETSPKRFFGTSRKQILNKIDTFLGKPGTADESSSDVTGASPDTGLVSNRISLFHNITRTEEKPWNKRKCQSMHNISQRKDSERSNLSVDESEIRYEPQESHVIPTKQIVKASVENVKCEPQMQTPVLTLQDKRARMTNKVHTVTIDDNHQEMRVKSGLPSVQKSINKYNKLNPQSYKYKPNIVLRKSSISKSEMDIFNKSTNNASEEDDLDKYKSCDELPKINVKNFISLYESVSKTEVQSRPNLHKYKSNNSNLQKFKETSSSLGAVNMTVHTSNKSQNPVTNSKNIHKQFSEERLETKPCALQPVVTIAQNKNEIYAKPNFYTTSKLQDSLLRNNRWESKSQESLEAKSIDSSDIEIVTTEDLEKETTYVSLSDVELEIIENQEMQSKNTSPEREVETAHIDYKSRFKLAKQFFQSLEELRDVKKPPKGNESELLVLNKSTESLEKERPQKRVKKNIKAHSMPSSEISKIWNQLQSNNEDNNSKLVKISEKFNVDDLFTDVMHGKLSRQGSLRGIPHKKAVLEAFKSMENLTDNKFSPYDITMSQVTDLVQDNKITQAQTYLSEYPYLPKTDPSKYHSRLDAAASGLITLKELQRQKPRRNSVPDLRMNPKFTVEL